MKDFRAKFFFWLGVLVLPIFWAWFTLSKVFTNGERRLAFGWLVIYGAAAAWKWQGLAVYLELLPIGYPLVIFWLTAALYGWLFIRIGWRFGEFSSVDAWVGLLIAAIMPLDRLDQLQAPMRGLIMKGALFSCTCLLLPLIAVALHWLLNPAWKFLGGYVHAKITRQC